MKKPKCRLCGHEHWASEAHTWSPGVAEEGAGAGSPKPGRGAVRGGAVVPVAGKASPKPVAAKKPEPVLPPKVAAPGASAVVASAMRSTVADAVTSGTLAELRARLAEIEAEKAVLREKVRERVRRHRAKAKGET